MRGDLEILGYNMLQWITGSLPWEKSLKLPKTVQSMKEAFMKNVRSETAKHSANIPDALIKFFEYINSLKPKDSVDYVKCKQIIENYLKSEGATRGSKLEFTNKKRKPNKVTEDENDSDTEKTDKKVLKKNTSKENGDVKVTKRSRKVKEVVEEENSENEEPEVIDVRPLRRGKKAKSASTDSTEDSPNERIRKMPVRAKKRKSMEPSVLVKVKKTKMAPKSTPPVKKNHINIGTQTSVDKLKRSPRQVSFDSPISAVLGDDSINNGKNSTANTSVDIFEDSFVIEDKKVKSKRKLLAKEELTVTKVVKKKMTSVKPKTKSWKDISTIVNGRSPPKD